MAEPPLYERLKAIQPEGTSENAWIAKAGVSRNFFQALKAGSNPRSDTLRRIVEAAGMTLAEFHSGKVERPESNAQIIPMEGASLAKPQGNLPVYGTALGAERRVDGEAIEQTTLNKAEIVEYMKRPTILNGRQGAYALHVQGYSMHPALPDGEMIVAVPDMPLSIGDNVVVYLRTDDPDEDDGATARAVLVKELVRRSSSYVLLRQYQPAGDFRIDMSEVLRIDRVLTRREMLS